MVNNLKGFLLMVSFFTRIPIGNKVEYTEEKYLYGLKWFPFVGIVIGVFLLPVSLIGKFDQNIKGILLVLIYLFVTGGIHLDGLADSSDGLFSNRNKERVLEIMKDSHIGTFGVISLILYFLIFTGLAGHLSWKWILLMPYVGKSFGLVSASISNYARQDHGMGFLFIETLRPRHALVHLIIMCCFAIVLLSIDGIIALCFSALVMLVLLRIFNRVIEGQTGDTIGMVIEVTQIAFMTVGYILS
ncbi:adenosylcobinamide-GDP ribazoletransferase [Fusibacter bizertensis]